MTGLWVRPFRPILYSPLAGDLSDLIAPPYDVIDEEKEKQLLTRHPYNVVRLLVPPHLARSSDAYERASQLWDDWRRQGILLENDNLCIFVYQQHLLWKGEQVEHWSLLCTVPLTEPEKGWIRPHEKTVPSTVEDRLALLQATFAELSQVFALMDAGDRWDPLLRSVSHREPTLQARDDQCLHRAWAVDDPSFIDQACRIVSTRWLMIADGHHRYQTALAFASATGDRLGNEETRYVGMVISDFRTGATIAPTHRLLQFASPEDRERFLAQVRRKFFIERLTVQSEGPLPEDLWRDPGGMRFVVVASADCLVATVTPLSSQVAQALAQVPPPLRKIPTAILHLGLLPVLMAEAGVRPEAVTVQYTHDDRVALSYAVRDRNLSILLPAPTPEQVMEVAAQGLVLPPKSTYFFPKVPSGFVMRSLK